MESHPRQCISKDGRHFTENIQETNSGQLSLMMKTWNWVHTTYNDGTIITPRTEKQFTLTFDSANTFSITTDCNHGTGEYTVSDTGIVFGMITSTEMACAGSQEGEFKTDLNNVQSYHLTPQGELVLNIKFDSGSMLFNPGDVTAENDRKVRGTIVSVNTDQIPADGPALVSVRQEDGNQVVIAIRSMGINLCPAQANIADVYTLKSGDMIEAQGQIGEDAMIIPCESSAHYLKVIK